METMIQDIRFALRVLARSPAFTVTAVFTLMLGIGATTTVFSLVQNAFYLPMPHVNQPENITWFFQQNGTVDTDRDSVSVADYLDWKQQATRFSSITALNTRPLNVMAGSEPERVMGVTASADFFITTGTTPLHGRLFAPGDDQPGADRVVVLSHGYWSRRMDSRADVIGTSMILDGTRHTIVGVTPRGFAFLPRSMDVYVPLVVDGKARLERTEESVAVIGRLKPGETLDAAQEEMKTISANLADRYPDTNKGWTVSLVPVQELFIGPRKMASTALLLASALVLLIACANVANLLLARAASRRREMAIRAAVGATRRRLVIQLLVKSLVLSFLGAGLGVLLALWGVDLFLASIPADLQAQLPDLSDVAVDGRCLVFTASLAVVAALVFGAVPALRASRPDLSQVFKDAGPSSTPGRGTRRLNNLLVAAQVVAALVLMLGAALTTEILVRSQHVELGFQSRGLLTACLHLSETRYAEEGSRVRLHDDLLQRLSVLPGVRSVTLADRPPLQRAYLGAFFTVEGQPIPDAAQKPWAKEFMIASNYFTTMGIPLISGRVFDHRDRKDGPPVAIISETLAKVRFPGENPVGKRIVVEDDATREIVGVVGEVHDSFQRNTGFLYVPYLQQPTNQVAVLVRTEGNPADLAGAVRNAIHAMDPQQPVFNLRTVEQLQDLSLVLKRVLMQLFMVLAAVALLLAAVGIQGVVAFTAAQREQELSIRSALGATRRVLLVLVLRDALVVVLGGVVVALVLSVFTTRGISQALDGPPTLHLGLWMAVTLLMLGVALVASWLPARRALARG